MSASMRPSIGPLLLVAMVAGGCAQASEVASEAESTLTGAPSTTTVTASTADPLSTTTMVDGTTSTSTTTEATTTTRLADLTPPELVVTDPEAGATVATRSYRFRGTTEPGCTVTAAGRYDVDVDAAGAWAIVLMLDPGGNMASFVSTDPAGNATEVRVPVYYEPPIELRSDGLGLADFDDSAGEVLALFTDRLGSAPTDPGPASGWVEYVGWPAGLYLGFSTPAWDRYDGVSRFVGWLYSGSEFRTPEGIGVGTTVAELVAQYGDRVQLPDTADVCAGWVYHVANATGQTEPSGELSGAPDAEAEVVALAAGLHVGC